jgi:nucleoside-diphosphate-sugar epimerase
VAISSQDVYRAYDRVTRRDPGPPDEIPLSEEAPLRDKLYPYELEGVEGYEKILVEEVVMGDPELPGTILRLPAVYGPGDYQHRFFEYVRRMDDGRPAILLGEGMASWRWTHGYVEDVAHAITLAVSDERAAGRIYNVGEPDPPSWAEWVGEIGRATGWSGEVVVVLGVGGLDDLATVLCPPCPELFDHRTWIGRPVVLTQEAHARLPCQTGFRAQP